MFKTYHVRQHNVRQTLLAMLRRVFPDQRDDQLRSMISRRRIQIDGNVCVDSHRLLKANEVIRVYDSPLARPIESSDINIRFQDEHLMVVEKPAGVTSVRGDDEEGRRDKSPTLDELLQQRIDREGLSKLPGRGAGAGAKNQKDRRQLASNLQNNRVKVKIRPVHRLDRDTSGLMLFALSPSAEEKLNAMFAEHSIDRAYLAVVQGKIESQKIESDFVRDRGDGLRGSVTGDAKRDGAKHAVTHIKLVRHIGDQYSLIDCRLETGRTHQIRIHLSESGHPLCGEKTYTRPQVGADPIKDESGAPRQALHAHRLHLVHPITGKPHTFESKFPRDLHKWLSKLEDSLKK
jgi:23S rRNA pseudouridine1911/1915/1917 synthase